MKKTTAEQSYTRVKSWASYRDLGGGKVSISSIQAELSQWQLDGVLGVLSAISSKALEFPNDFYRPKIQERYLNYALADSFPHSLPKITKKIRPGFAPNVDGHGVLAHAQNLAWLTHQAILHCKNGGLTSKLSHSLRTRVARLLLIANDHLQTELPKTENPNLIERRHLVLDMLRRWQFSQSLHIDNATQALLRQRNIFLKILPKYFDVSKAFERVTNGVHLDVYFAVVMVMRFFFFTKQLEKATGNKMETGLHEHIIKKSTFFSKLESNQEQAETIFSWWITNPQLYERQHQEWRRIKPEGDLRFDYVQLRIAPLIEARPDDLFFPVPHFLLQKVVDEPYFRLAEGLTGTEKTKFFQALGDAYEEYANELVCDIANKDTKGQWTYFPNLKTEKGNEEITDALLYRNGTAVVFEHNALRPDTDFLVGGNGDKILGPPDEFLKQLETRKLDAKATKKENKGLISRIMNQQTLSAPHLEEYIIRFQGNIKKVYPLSSHLADLHVDKYVYGVFLEPLISRNNFYLEDFWQPPQWLHIADLELLANLAAEGSLDFEALLEEKNQSFKRMGFDEYLANIINARERKLPDHRTHDRLHEAIRETKALLYPVSSAKNATHK